MTQITNDPKTSPPRHDNADRLRHTAEEAKAAVQQRAGDLRDTAQSTLAEAKGAAEEKSEELKGQAATQLSKTAEGLEAAADELQDAPFQQDMLQQAAEGLRQISHAIEGKSVGRMVEDLSDFGRNNPMAYLGGAALAGFALARFARASGAAEAEHRQTPRPDTFAEYRAPNPSGLDVTKPAPVPAPSIVGGPTGA